MCLSSARVSGGSSLCVCVCVRSGGCDGVCVCLQVRARLSARCGANTPNAGCSQMSVCAVQVAWQRAEVERAR